VFLCFKRPLREVFFILSISKPIDFEREKKKGKKKRESFLTRWTWPGQSRFFGKIQPKGWRFYQKPAGLDLDGSEEGWPERAT
tara:strand:+ start:133 stop:381 length:249 start_codon:yes stop_codon:yes gene_type:complete